LLGGSDGLGDGGADFDFVGVGCSLQSGDEATCVGTR
jgi:hypothetical protein